MYVQPIDPWLCHFPGPWCVVSSSDQRHLSPFGTEVAPGEGGGAPGPETWLSQAVPSAESEGADAAQRQPWPQVTPLHTPRPTVSTIFNLCENTQLQRTSLQRRSPQTCFLGRKTEA